MNKKPILATACALALAVSAVSLTACTGGTAGVSVASSADATDATAAGTTSSVTIYVTEPQTTQAPARNVEDYVYTAEEYEIAYSGAFLLTGQDYGESDTAPARLPQLTMNSVAADKINTEIHQRLAPLFDSYRESEYVMGRADYVAVLNGDVLSLAIESRSVDTPNSSFLVYNINVVTGEVLSNSQVIAMSGISEYTAYDAIRSDANARCDETKEKVNNNPQLLEQLEQVRERTLSEENLSKADFFFNADGKLCGVYRYYWIAGAENYGAIVETDGSFQG